MFVSYRIKGSTYQYESDTSETICTIRTTQLTKKLPRGLIPAFVTESIRENCAISNFNHLHHFTSHFADKAGHVAPLGAQYLQGLPSLMVSTTYWKSMSGTHENQCISPCTCGLLQTSKPLDSRRRLKNASVSTGQHSEVVSLKPAASSDALAPLVAGWEASELGFAPVASNAAWRRTAWRCDSCRPSGRQPAVSFKCACSKVGDAHDLSEDLSSLKLKGSALTWSIALACAASVQMSSHTAWP